jgi:ATP/ADP translocase
MNISKQIGDSREAQLLYSLITTIQKYSGGTSGSINNLINLSQDYFAQSNGEKGHSYLVAATPTTAVGVIYFALQVLEDSVITYKDGATTHSNISVAQYDTIYGNLSEIDVVSGRVRIYLK